MTKDIITENKLKIFNRYRWLLELVPYSRKFSVVGSVGEGTAREESDIDLLVLAQENRVWLNRLLLNFVLLMIGQRRNHRHRADRFCLNASLGGSYNFEPSLLTHLRTLLEWLLEITFLGSIFEWTSKKIFSSYIKARFRRFSLTSDTVLILGKEQIIYHPPR